MVLRDVGRVLGLSYGHVDRLCKMVPFDPSRPLTLQESIDREPRFKDEVKEVRESTECGMAFENYSDIQEGDMIECFEITEVARTLD